jgi:hypothetical protein
MAFVYIFKNGFEILFQTKSPSFEEENLGITLLRYDQNSKSHGWIGALQLKHKKLVEE